MLGFNPLASTSLASIGSTLIAIPAVMAATATLTFSGTPMAGAFVPMSASATLTFAGSPALYKNQLITASGTIRFGGDPVLRTAGKPFIINAISERFNVRAETENWQPVALPQVFTLRAIR